MKYSAVPRAIEIQTISACNARCIICPHPQVSRELPQGSMDQALFRNIIDQIQPSWECRVIPYLNSEPLLDASIVDRLTYVCSRLRYPNIELSTNVSALTPFKQELLRGIRIQELRLSIFGFTESTHGHCMPGLKWHMIKRNLDHLTTNWEFRKTIDQITLVMVQHPDLTESDIELARRYCKENSLSFADFGFLDRAGNVTHYSNDVFRAAIIGCEQSRPLERMHITFTGDVILCCQDWRWNNVIGNVKNSTLLEIWNSAAYRRYRERIYSGDGTHPDVCSRCKLSVPAH